MAIASASLPLRIVYMGTPDFAVPALRLLVARPQLSTVVGVVTQPDRPRGRGRKVSPSPIKACAQGFSIPVFEFTKLRAAETQQILADLAADLFVVAAYGRILPQAILDLPRVGCINIHASLLPKWRGASPIAHALWHGDAEAGVAIMQMAAGLDTGPVFGMQALKIAADDTCGSLTARLAELGAHTLVTLLPIIASGTCEAAAQNDAGATFAPLLGKAHGRLNWRLPGDVLARQIRAFDPWPGTYSFLHDPTGQQSGPRVAVVQAEAQMATAGPAGQVLEVSKRGVVVGCGAGSLRLHAVKPEGRSLMPAAVWATGRSITSNDSFEIY